VVLLSTGVVVTLFIMTVYLIWHFSPKKKHTPQSAVTVSIV
jgi:heme/copper-type cytochrome/quinol oxidase subunit 2